MQPIHSARVSREPEIDRLTPGDALTGEQVDRRDIGALRTEAVPGRPEGRGFGAKIEYGHEPVAAGRMQL